MQPGWINRVRFGLLILDAWRWMHLRTCLQAGDGEVMGTDKPAANIRSLVAEGSFPCLRDEQKHYLAEQIDDFSEVYDIPVVGTAPKAYSLRNGAVAVRAGLNRWASILLCTSIFA